MKNRCNFTCIGVVILLIFLFNATKLYAQKPFSIPPVIPPSPNVGSLFKFIENPVSTYTGLPEISIPVYTISNKGLNIPISLRYHSGGVKVADAASWVGMGWALQAGGVITQSVRGIKDDHVYGRFNTTPANLNALLDPDLCVLKQVVDGRGDSEPDVFSFSFNGKSGQFYFNDSGGIVQFQIQKFKIEANIYGSAPDRKIGSWKVTDVDGTQYFFDQTELLTSQGKALDNGVLLGDGEIGNYPVEDQKSWMLTSIIQANSDTISFSYETYSAVDCIFNSETRTYRKESSRPNTTYPPLQYTKNFNKQNIHVGKRLKSIQFPEGRIEFVSGSNRCDLYGDKFLDKIQVFNLYNQKVKELDLEYNYFEGNNRYPTNVVNCTAEASPEVPSSAAPYNHFKDRRLFLMSVNEKDENGNSNGSYLLDYETSIGLPNRFSAEQDLWGFYNGNGYTSLLQNIHVSNQYLDGFQLHNIYGRNPSLLHTKQGTLTKITYPTGGYTTYDYELNSLTSSLAPTSTLYPEVSFSVSGANTPQFLQNISVMGTSATLTFEVDKCIFGPNTTTVGFYIADVNNNVVVSGSQVTSDLQSTSGTGVVSYTLNTGQYKLYSYAALPFPCTYNIKFKAWTDQLPAQDNYDSGGLRIKKITNYDPVTNANTSKTYNYTELIGGKELSTGQYAIPVANFRNQYVSWVSEGFEFSEFGCTDYYSKGYTLQSSTNYPLASNQNNSVGYLKVTEKSTDESGIDLGYVHYEFTGGADNSSDNPMFAGNAGFYLSGNDKYPWVPAENRGWTRGKPLKVEYFRREGAGYRRVKAQTNTYSSLDLGSPYTNAFSASYVMQGYCSTIMTCANGVRMNDAFRYSRYKLGSGCLLLSSEKTEEIDENNNTLSTLVSYEYNPDNFLPSKVTTTNSVAGSTIQFIKYPSDYSGITAVDPLSAGIKALKDAYVLDKPIEQFTQRVVNNTNVGTVQALFNSYKNSNLQPEKIFVAKITQPMIDFSQAQVQSGAITKDSRYESRALFNQYDAYDNIVEQQMADGAKEVYLWGYHGRYVVAKVIGSDYATVAALVDLSILNNPSSDLLLRNELNDIRVNLPNTMVSTYTYKPLVGMTSSTDTKGMTTTYEYDGFQRLKNVKDQDGNIVKSYDYHYKP